MSGSGLTPEERDAALKQAAENGFEVIKADNHTLLLDLDSLAAVQCYERALPLLEREFPVLSKEQWTSKSGNLHVRITLGEEYPWSARYALECALGSDGKRGILSVLRMYAGCDEGSVLFKPQQKKAETEPFPEPTL